MPVQLTVLIRSLFAFFSLLILSRILNKKQIKNLTFFEYIVGIAIGDIATSLSVDSGLKVSALMIGLAVWAGMPVLINLLAKRYYWVRKLVDGMPTVIVQGGKVMEGRLKKANMTVDDMMQLLRGKQVFNLADVEFAVLEKNGDINALKKTDTQPVTPKTLGLTVENQAEPRTVVIDGALMERTLLSLGYTKEWLLGELKKQGANSFDDVFLAQVDAKGNVYADLYRDIAKQPEMKPRALLAASLRKIQADMESFALQTENPNAKAAYTENAKRLQEMMDQVGPYLRE